MAQKVRKRFIDVIVIDPFTVQFCALSIILLAFFILLNSMAVIDEERVRLALGSLIGAFGRVPGGAEEIMDRGMLGNPNIHMSDEDAAELSTFLSDLLGDENLEGDVLVTLRGEDVVIRIEGRALFGAGSDTLLPGADNFLRGVIEILQQSDRDVTIEGHTDEVSTAYSRFGTPWMFAASRAARVHDFFVAESVDDARLTVASYGRTNQIYPNESEFQRSLNRRIEIVVKEGVFDPLFRPHSHVESISGYDVVVENFPVSEEEGSATP